MPVRQSAAFGSEIGNRGRAAAEAPSRLQILRRRLQRASDSINKRMFWAMRRGPVLRFSLTWLGSRVGRAAVVAFTAILAAATVGKG
jgi:hypothetical protein